MRQMMKRKDTYEHGKKAPVDLTAPLQVKIATGIRIVIVVPASGEQSLVLVEPDGVVRDEHASVVDPSEKIPKITIFS